MLVLATDGIWEARNPSSEMFGKESMNALLKEHKDKTAGQIVEEIACSLAYRFGRDSTVAPGEWPKDPGVGLVIKTKNLPVP